MTLEDKLASWAEEHNISLTISAVIGLGRIIGEAMPKEAAPPVAAEETVVAAPDFKYAEEDLINRVMYMTYVTSCIQEGEDYLTGPDWLAMPSLHDESYRVAVKAIIDEARLLK